jgi:hypothetical protein
LQIQTANRTTRQGLRVRRSPGTSLWRSIPCDARPHPQQCPDFFLIEGIHRTCRTLQPCLSGRCAGRLLFCR